MIGRDALNINPIRTGAFKVTLLSRDHCLCCLAAAAIFLFPLFPAFAADQQFQGELDPLPHDNSTRDNVVGTGTVSATLSGNTLTVSGSFSGLSSPASAAHLEMGLAMGVPGTVIGSLGATQGPNGQISGSIKLNAAEIAALKKGAVYVQLDSVKAPDGNSWSWLESAETNRP